MIITNVMAASLDGMIAARRDEPDRERRRYGFTTEDDYRHLLEQLRLADAIIVGGRSLMATGQVIDVKNERGVTPTWVVITERGLPRDARFWGQRHVPRWVVQPSSADGGVDGADDVRRIVVQSGQYVRPLAEALKAAKFESVVLLGGGEVNRAFYQERLVNRLVLTVCPIILGAASGVPVVRAPLPHPVSLELEHSQARGNLVFLKYKILHT